MNEVHLILHVSDPRLDDDERENIAQQFYRELNESDVYLGEVFRPRQAAPEGAKSIESAIVGTLTAILSAGAVKAFFDYLTERWRGHEVTIDVQHRNKKISVKARRPEDIVVAYHAAVSLSREMSSTTKEK